MSWVLVVDDEAGIRRLVAAVLARGGLNTRTAADARAALALVREGARDGPAAAIVDLGLPDRDGLELVTAFAAAGVPTLVLSARTATEDKVAALDLGAEDFVAKPFDGDELLARVRAVLRRAGRRAGREADGAAAFGPFRVDAAFHRATLNGRALELTPREFALLEALVEAGGRVLTHRALLTRVWGPAHGDDVEYLRVAVRALRRKVEDAPATPRLILNEPGVGYRMAGPQDARF